MGAYTPTTYKKFEVGGTMVTADRLNNTEQGVKKAHDELNELRARPALEPVPNEPGLYRMGGAG